MSARPRIAIGLEYPLALRGGVSVLVETLLPGLQDRYEIVLISPDTAETMKNHPAFPLLAGHIQWNPGAVSRETSRRLAEKLAIQKVQLAHFHIGGVFGWGNRIPGQSPVAFLRGMRAVSTVHLVVGLLDGYCGPQKSLSFKLAMLPLAWLGKLSMLRKLDLEIAVSQHDEEKLKRWYWPQRSKFTQLYHSRLKRENHSLPELKREPIILNVGHVAWRKGQILLAAAFARVAKQHPEWKLWLAGDLTEKTAVDAIRAIAEKNNLQERIVLLGERSDAMELMRRAGIYVQPSYFEALGLALQEAQFLGTPSIGTRVGGIPELITHEQTGLLVEAGHEIDVAAALDRLISHPEERAAYGRAAATDLLARGMTVDKMLDRHIELYDSLLDAK